MLHAFISTGVSCGHWGSTCLRSCTITAISARPSEVAVAEHLPTATEEFRTLNRCLDTAIAAAVTEHARING